MFGGLFTCMMICFELLFTIVAFYYIQIVDAIVDLEHTGRCMSSIINFTNILFYMFCNFAVLLCTGHVAAVHPHSG